MNMDDPLPRPEDFADPQSRDPDELHALKMFLGKTRCQAEEMFRKDFLGRQEDLAYMRAPAFRFYVLPAMQYLVSDAADADSDAASAFCQLLESRLDREPGALDAVAPAAANAIRAILSRFARYGCDVAVYGDVRTRYEALLPRVTAVSADPAAGSPAPGPAPAGQ